jgi:hypothetical protein
MGSCGAAAGRSRSVSRVPDTDIATFMAPIAVLRKITRHARFLDRHFGYAISRLRIRRIMSNPVAKGM